MSRTITIETSSPDSFLDITTGIQAAELILRSYRVDILASSTVPYRHLGLEIGNVINTSYVIDNQVGSNFFRLPLASSSPVTVGSGGASVISTFVSNCSIPLTMTGHLDKQFFLRCRYLDRTVSPPVFKMVPSGDLVYLSLTFEAIKSS